MHYPSDSLGKWDLLNEHESYYGIYALDTHGELEIGNKISLHFPTYRSMFEIMTVYVRTDGFLNRDAKQASAEIMTSLKQGRFFNVVEAIAPANGFDAFFNGCYRQTNRDGRFLPIRSGEIGY